MESDSILGRKDSQVSEYFNFADVIDKWAREEKVSKYNSNKKDVNLSSSVTNV